MEQNIFARGKSSHIINTLNITWRGLFNTNYIKAISLKLLKKVKIISFINIFSLNLYKQH